MDKKYDSKDELLQEINALKLKLSRKEKAGTDSLSSSIPLYDKQQEIAFTIANMKLGFGMLDSDFKVSLINKDDKNIFRKLYDMPIKDFDSSTDSILELEKNKPDKKNSIFSEELSLDEENKPVRTIKIPYQDENGDWLEAEINVKMGDKVQAEMIKESEKHLRYIIENTKAGYFRIDRKGLYQKVNKAWLNMHGFSSMDEIIGKPYIASFDPSEFSRIQNYMNSLLNGEQLLQEEFASRNIDGSIYYHTLIATPIITDGIVVGAEGFLVDVTEHKRLVQNLKDSNAFYRKMMDVSLDMIVTVDRNGAIIEANKAVVDALGISREDLIGTEVYKYFADPDRTRKDFLFAIKNGLLRDFEIEINHKDGSKIPLLCNASVIKDENGKISGVLASARNVSSQKATKATLVNLIEQLRKSNDRNNRQLFKLNEMNFKLMASEAKLKQLNATKDKCFSIISHDLRRPFYDLIKNSESLLEKYDSLKTSDVKSRLKDISSLSKYSHKLLVNLINWASLQTGQFDFMPQVFNINKELSETFDHYTRKATKKKIDLEFCVDDKLEIRADKNMINSLLSNIISNAIKYTPKKGRISVYAEKLDKGTIFTVEDNGIGIPENLSESIFEIETNQLSGGNDYKGLGLILCKEFVDKHSGEIWIVSKQGEGCKVSFFLPQ